MTMHRLPFSDGPRPPACAEVADALPLLHDHELGVAETAAVEAHLATCAACQDEAEAYARLSSALKRLDAADMVEIDDHPLAGYGKPVGAQRNIAR